MIIPETAFSWIVLAWIGFGLTLLPVQLFISPPYGRHNRKGWGWQIPNRLGWIIMELPALLIIPIFFLFRFEDTGLTNRLFLLLWSIHYIHRALIYPFRIRTSGKKIPLSVAAMAFFFNLINGLLNGYYLTFLNPSYPQTWISDPRFIIGMALFIAGMLMNLISDQVLIELRKNDQEYSIPRGWLFTYVSCPNFLGELIEWTGFAILTWSLPSLSFLAWTTSNLLPRALMHHRWYIKTFPDYPAVRKAIIPFLL